MPFYFRHDTHNVNLEDLPLTVWVKIEAATGIDWPEILTSKCLGSAKVATAVVTEVASHLGVTLPEMTLRSMVQTIVFSPDEHLPTSYQDGMPDPKATATETATD